MQGQTSRFALISAGCAALAASACIPELALRDESTSGVGAHEAGGGAGAGGDASTEPFEIPADVAEWLSKEPGGWCNDSNGKFINLCGDTKFCFDATLLKTFPNGLAIDLGFHWAGLDGGSLVTLGTDDAASSHVQIALAADGLVTVAGPGDEAPLEFRVAQGSHLLSYRVSTAERALFIDGVGVASAAASLLVPRLGHGPAGAPAAVLGHTWYWGLEVRKPYWLRFAPFFFHMRDASVPSDAFELATATTKQDSTLMLFHGATATDTEWKAEFGPQNAYAAGGTKWVGDVDANCL
ncbi:MAG: hypothetical protein EXR75_04065 [Myxococcales bacterium]|nr:hypothetical protein [Myxococcales bacterium]